MSIVEYIRASTIISTIKLIADEHPILCFISLYLAKIIIYNIVKFNLIAMEDKN